MSANRSEKDVAEDLEDYKEQLENEISLLERKLARIKSHKKRECGVNLTPQKLRVDRDVEMYRLWRTCNAR